MLNDLGSAADITQQVARLLRAADANQRLPTPVDDIVAAAELVSTREVAISESMIERAPETMRALLRSAKRKILGVLDRRERVIQIAPNGSAERERFVTCHEVAHHIFPWQADLAVLGDDSRTLAPSVTRLFEQEANQGAAEILFQQSLLATIARDYPVEMSTPLQLAALFGASAHATFRRWLEGLDETVCGLVLDVADTGDQRKRYEQLLTPRWQARFGPDGYPRRLDASEFPACFLEVMGGSTARTDLDGAVVRLRYETFQTPYRRFVLIWIPTRSGFVARHRRRAILVPGRS